MRITGKKYAKYIIDTPNVGGLGFGVLPKGELMMGRTQSHTYVEDALIPGVGKHVFISGIHRIPEPNPWLKFHHHPHDEIILFMGTDPHNIQYLGAEVEVFLGDEKERESYLITKTSGIYIPAGLEHNWVYHKVDKPHFLVGFSMGGEYK